MIDELIAVIRKSPSSAEAKTEIEAKFGFSDRQAKAIIDLRLGKLSGLELSELQKEQVELAIIISECQKLLASSQEQNKEFLSRLKSFVKQFAYPRHTEVINIDLEA
jgi:DNA gyrase/topoisomerase IV subunit A